MADRYYSPEPSNDGTLVLRGDEAKHLARVARRVVGDEVEVFDGLGNGYLGRVATIGTQTVELRVLASAPDRDPARDLTLYVATPKGDRMDWLVEKATELGVRRLLPIRCSRSVVEPRPTKLDRLRRVVIEASKQCGRSRLMTIADPISWAEAMGDRSIATRFLADAGGLDRGAWPAPPAGEPIAVAIGPEGGWTDAERSAAAEAGWVRIGLGPTRLRVETAALAASALFLSENGDVAP